MRRFYPSGGTGRQWRLQKRQTISSLPFADLTGEKARGSENRQNLHRIFVQAVHDAITPNDDFSEFLPTELRNPLAPILDMLQPVLRFR